MQTITEIRKTGRTYPNPDGTKFTVQYTVYLDGDNIVDIRNPHNFSLEKGSETWEYLQGQVAKWREMKRVPA